MKGNHSAGTRAVAIAIQFLLTSSLTVAGTPDNLAVASSRWSFADMDKMSGVKGWNFGFPSFGDTLLQDYGGWRSSLASAGIGLIEYNLTPLPGQCPGHAAGRSALQSIL